MNRMTCIVCPKGCQLYVGKKNNEFIVNGNSCKRGIDFAIEEIESPKRTLQTTVKTNFTDFPRLPVKTNQPIPKDKIFDIMKIINSIIIETKVSIGDIIIKNILDTGCNIVATTNMY